ncbi:SDR family NAD(P)-dependent oxidoreductase [Dactylosporangium sucinum]|uniref:Short-chain dehydrogenase n=1 Tax=Dactylosporangium sucinum TaxID=1424081 RepID=A0A917U4J1_9ACTN|nr:SDR family oxidoreductase [Dactylosporangium sucinum]GGM54602.1 short-chain dehydrogenase [Dactylosporangium sucinum]
MSVLEGKAVVVTGAGQGLGAAYALLAAAEGAAVVVNDVDAGLAAAVVERIRSAGGRAEAAVGTVATWEGAGAIVDRCVEAFGAIDGLVNNAGIFRLAHPAEQDPAEFARVVEVNLLGSAYCGLHAIRAMLPRGRGSIVNVTSGAHAGSAAMGAYGASKGGVASLTYCWAADLAGTGVRVNAVSPNAHTRMADAFEAYLGAAAQGQNLHKSPEQNAPAVIYLLSDAAAGVHGQVVRIDGDELSMVAHPTVLGEGTHDPSWSVGAVAAAFAAGEVGPLMPVGLHRSRHEADLGA